MTISQNPSAPLVAVVGATGAQGGSVPAAQDLIKRGVEVVVVSLVIENKEEVYKAFTGADIAFLVTNFWEHGEMEREINEGKLLIDAAKSGGVSRIIWSGLPSFSKLSGGRLVHAHHFESKAAVTEYARQSGVPFVELQAGFYGTNFVTLPMLLAKQADGQFAMPWPVKPTTKLPFIDIDRDYGLWARHLLELPVFPDGSSFISHGEYISIQDMAQQLAQVTGKDVVFKQISMEQFKQNVQTAGFPPNAQESFADVWEALDEIGWSDTATTENLPRRPSTWVEFAERTDWSKALV
ncbi:NmrA domain-containing protein [Mycena venus]|uniref:NmrA domain-containing protein n=1 Tax=Mycena venus TaxID=2733690 RepID=A0A8H6X7Y7_9AGAR|nr:NmrA domain-containing protein [Mycena venus]